MTLPDRPALDRPTLAALGGPWSVTVVETSVSTNVDLVAAAASTPTGAVLVAEHQTAGLGRLGRQWESPARSSLTVSLLLRPPVDVARWGWLPLLAGVALVESIVALDVDAALKWPNDVLVGPEELKIAGVLAQVSGDAVVVGIGVNVTNTAAELPIPTATSLARAGASSVDRTDLLVGLLGRVELWYRGWVAAGGDAEASGLAAAYRAHCGTIGRAVTVSAIAGDSHAGTVTGIDSDGRLRLHTVAGVDLSIAAGDVHHLRPAGR